MQLRNTIIHAQSELRESAGGTYEKNARKQNNKNHYLRAVKEQKAKEVDPENNGWKQ